MTKRSLGAQIVENLLYIACADIAALFIKFIFNLILSPIINEVALSFSQAAADSVERVFDVVYIAAFLVIVVVIMLKNPVTKGRYLNETFGREYKFGEDFVSSFKESWAGITVASAIFALPMNLVLLIFGDINYVPMLFVPYYSMWSLTANVFASYIVSTVLTALVIIVMIPIAHACWESKRLRR